jgi:F-type H+-transporting ATPase subunit b
MATETVGAEVDAGMPQLDFSTFPNQIFWLAITLVVLYFILSRIALPRIGSVLAERAGTVTNDIAAAEDLKKRAVAAEAAYDKALADARTEANRIIAAAKADMQAELDVELRKADAEIAALTAESERSLADIRDSALTSVTEVAKATALEIVNVFGQGGDAAAVDAAVEARIKG